MSNKDYYNSGEIASEAYLLDNNYHRLDGPAIIIYYLNGQICSESYYTNGVRHRLDGPAWILYDAFGKIIKENYYNNNEQHRLDGPAWIEYNNFGKIISADYYVNGVHLRDLYYFYQKTKRDIFIYIQVFPQLIKEVELLARHNNWLNEKELELLTCMDMFKTDL
jgi:hypothetical protein